MPIVTASGLSKYYGGRDVFRDVTARIEAGDRIGLVGPNGEGKTTLLRIIAGLEEPSAGRVEISHDLTIGYLPQLAELDGDEALHAAMLPAFAHLLEHQEALRELETEMAQAACDPTVFRHYGELQTQFELAGGYVYETQIRQVLAGLGFAEADLSKRLSIMSGGQRTRARLAKLLLEAPDLLLLDEPTNHLDLDGLEWLEKYLAGWRGSMVVVAHDRRFLDKLATRIWDLALGRLELYSGNYSQYVQQRAERIERRMAEYEAQQEEIARTEEFVRRYMAGQRTKEAQGRLRRLERLQRLERPQAVKRIHLNLQTDMRSGDLVLRTHRLVIGFAGPPRVHLLDCPDLLLQRGERAAVLGPNGSGKTTLLRTIVGEILPLSGEVSLGASVHVGYLAQANAGLKLESSVLEALLETRNLPISKARNFLGRFLFSGDDIYKRIGELSGGERSRVALAKLTLEGANLLILDEPTNHLDIASQEILEEVLSQFRGTILLVSHDRHLVDSLVSQVWLIVEGGLISFAGSYSEYLTAIGERAVEAPEGQGKRIVEADAHLDERRERMREARRVQRAERRRQERLEQIERIVTDLEQELQCLEQRLERASQEQRVSELHSLGQQYQETQGQIDKWLQEWAELA
jgi:ATP-binding cassette, subfamily F, member 3